MVSSGQRPARSASASASIVLPRVRRRRAATVSASTEAATAIAAVTDPVCSAETTSPCCSINRDKNGDASRHRATALLSGPATVPSPFMMSLCMIMQVSKETSGRCSVQRSMEPHKSLGKLPKATLVALPVDSDGIGKALRSTYKPNDDVPGNLAELMHALNSVAVNRCARGSKPRLRP